ncbi:MAG: marine proteobacterial sortase target protein [Pseudomonas sp.]
MHKLTGWLLVIGSLLANSVLASTPTSTPVSLNNWLNHSETGTLMVRHDAESDWHPALLLGTEVDIQISGPVARITLQQHFSNSLNMTAEGVYAFPLSERSAVHGMQMQVGQRRIVGAIHEKAQARQIYQQALSSGQRAGLVEQRRPNLFSTSVANIPAAESISVTLEYTELLVPDGNRFSLRLPLTMTPRFNPLAEPSDAEGAQSSHQDPSPEGRILANEQLPAQSHQVMISTYLDAGQQLQSLNSPSHTVKSEYDGRGYRLVLPAEQVPMDRDFVLDWQLQTELTSTASVFSEVIDGDNHALVMLMPGDLTSDSERMPREVIMVVDTSGSMGGERMRQARESLIYALGRLQPEDRFNVLEFNSYHRLLFRDLVAADEENILQARQWVRELRAEGGTNMLPVLRDAMAFPHDPDYLRQIIFITDGSVSNEAAILDMIDRQIHRARLFTVGIGAAPNSYLLRKAAEMGRGDYSYIAHSHEVEQQMARLFEKLERPVLTDLRIELPDGITADYWPEQLPDLYAGQPLIVAMRLNQMPAHITLHGKQPEPWQQRLTLPLHHQHPGAATLWARQKIEVLMDRLSRGESEEQVREDVLEVALKHRLLSRYTSFVAVDQEVVRDPQDPLHSQELGNRNPIDHQMSHAYPQTSLGLRLYWMLALILALLALVLLPRQRSLA